jgi:hypothetical protein
LAGAIKVIQAEQQERLGEEWRKYKTVFTEELPTTSDTGRWAAMIRTR